MFGRGKLVLYDPIFKNNDWSKIISACQSGKVPDTWKVGDQETMTINGTDYAIDIIGKDHDEYSDGTGTAPLTFQLHDCDALKNNMHYTDDNTVGWTGCKMRIQNLSGRISALPSEVQSALREVNKLTAAGGTSTTINITADKLFLLSEVEALGGVANSNSGEGSQYAYYSTTKNRVKKVDGTASFWWLRSPRKSSSNQFCGFSVSGATDTGYASSQLGVSFAFCF